MNLVERNTPIERRSLHDELVDRVRAMINGGDLKPGVKIPEKELCDKFAVSRTPLREALKVLSVEGLIKLTPNRGAAVVELTLQDLEEVFPVMASLEALSGELACERITDEEIAEIRRLHKNMAKEHERGNLPEYFRLNQAIHEAILNASRNSTLKSTHRSLAGRITRARYMANMSQKRWDKALEEHEQILEALSTRKKTKLSKILRDHVMTKFDTVKAALSARE